MSILGFFFLIILILVVFGFSILTSIIKVFFGLGKRTSNRQRNTYTNPNQPNSSTRNNSAGATHSQPPPQNHKKVFSKDEGEYVEFEEVKEEK